MTTLRSTSLVLLLSLLLVMVTGASVIEVKVTSSVDGETVLKRTADLRPHSEAGFERRVYLRSSGELVDLSLRVSLNESSPRGSDVSVSCILTPVNGGSATTWTSRSFSLSHGGTASFSSEPDGELRYEVSLLDAPRVEFRTTVVLHEVTNDGTRRLSEHRVRLAGPDATEVVFESPGGDGGLVVRLTPRGRTDDGATLALDIESLNDGSGVAIGIREDEVDLGWNDVVRISGLSGPGGELLVDIKPER